MFPEAYSSHFPSHGVNTQKSPLKTPVPRRYAPEPVPKNGKISEKQNSVVEKENIPKPTREGIVLHTPYLLWPGGYFVYFLSFSGLFSWVAGT